MSDKLIEELHNLTSRLDPKNKLAYNSGREEQIKYNSWLEKNQSLASNKLDFGPKEDMSQFFNRMDMITNNHTRTASLRSRQREISPQERAYKENNNVFNREDMIRRVDGETYAARKDTLSLSDKDFRTKYKAPSQPFTYAHYKASFEAGNTAGVRAVIPFEDLKRYDSKLLDPKGTRRRRDRVQSKLNSNRWFNSEWAPEKEKLQSYGNRFSKNKYNKDIRALMSETGLSKLDAKQLHRKLNGVKDNSERYRITDDYLTSREFRSKNVLNDGKPSQFSGANFTNTQGLSLSEINKIRDKEAANSVSFNKENRALKREQAKAREGTNFNPALWEEEPKVNRVSSSSNFLNSNGYKDTSYFSSYSDTTKVAIRANNDRLTGAYNKAVDDNGVGSRYKKALSSSDIQSKLDNYSKTKAGQSNLDRATQRRQQLEQANKNRLMRNSARFNRELISEKFKETAKNSYLNPASKIGGYVRELAENLPNHYADSLTALYNGVEVRETKSSLIDHYTKKLVDTFNPSESHITESNKKYAEGTLKQYEGVNRITGQGMNIDGLSKMSPSQLEYWKDIQRNITQNSLTNRVKGHNIDPFDNMTQDKEGNYRPNPHTSSVPTLDGDGKVIGFQDSPERSNFLKQIDDHKKEVSWIDGRLADLNNQSSNSIISERGTSTNRYSSFFGATDREQMNRVEFEELTSRRAEIQDRLNGYNMGYTGEHINSDFTGPMREGEARPIIPATSTRPAHTFDSYRPVFGTGYGLGFKGSMAASGGEHLARFAYFATPFGTGSGRQALMEAAGVMNKAQRFQATQARGFAKLGYAAVPVSALGMILMDMHQDKEVSEIAGNIFSMGTALHGWRMGASLGGAAGSMFGQVGKLIGLGLGGVGGLVGGLMIGQAVVDGISDAMSNDSKIRSFAKKAGTKEMYANTPETRQTLTARGAALQKLAKSGLNDRGLLLGNEATVLQGGM